MYACHSPRRVVAVQRNSAHLVRSRSQRAADAKQDASLQADGSKEPFCYGVLQVRRIWTPHSDMLFHPPPNSDMARLGVKGAAASSYFSPPIAASDGDRGFRRWPYLLKHELGGVRVCQLPVLCTVHANPELHRDGPQMLVACLFLFEEINK